MALATASGSHFSEMNVTPLVDVMLVLLIIFMVTVPAVDYFNAVPLGHSPPIDKVAPAPLRVAVGAGDTLVLDGQPVTLDQLRSRFALEAARGIAGGQVDPQKQAALELAVEPEADYGQVVKVMAAAKNEHLMRVSIRD